MAYAVGARHVAPAEIDLVEQDGAVRVLALWPISKFQQKWIGYGHPKL